MKEEKISCRAHAFSVCRSPSRHVCAIRGEGEDARGRQSTKKNSGVSGAGRREREKQSEKNHAGVERGLYGCLTRCFEPCYTLAYRDFRMYVANYAHFDKLITKELLETFFLLPFLFQPKSCFGTGLYFEVSL